MIHQMNQTHNSHTEADREEDESLVVTSTMRAIDSKKEEKTTTRMPINQ